MLNTMPKQKLYSQEETLLSLVTMQKTRVEKSDKLHGSVINSALSLSGTFTTLKITCSMLILKVKILPFRSSNLKNLSMLLNKPSDFHQNTHIMMRWARRRIKQSQIPSNPNHSDSKFLQQPFWKAPGSWHSSI